MSIGKNLLDIERSIYLDTSFILNSLYESIDSNKWIVNNSIKALWLLLSRAEPNCYISNITLNELFNVIERSWFRSYVDKKIIQELKINESMWKSYSIDNRKSLRNEYDKTIWLNIKDIKNWRNNNEFKLDYKAYVLDEFLNILDSLPNEIKIISNFINPELYKNDFIKTKKKYFMLDSNDVNHYLLCKSNSIDCLLTNDSDFKEIDDLKILHIN